MKFETKLKHNGLNMASLLVFQNGNGNKTNGNNEPVSGWVIDILVVFLQCDLERGVGMPDDTAISEFAQEAGFIPKWYRKG